MKIDQKHSLHFFQDVLLLFFKMLYASKLNYIFPSTCTCVHNNTADAIHQYEVAAKLVTENMFLFVETTIYHI